MLRSVAPLVLVAALVAPAVAADVGPMVPAAAACITVGPGVPPPVVLDPDLVGCIFYAVLDIATWAFEYARGLAGCLAGPHPYYCIQ